MTNGFNDAPKPSEAIHIPPAALDAGARAYRTQHYTVSHEDAIRAAFVAMVSAWPGVSAKQANEHVALFNSQPALILPLTQTQENGDER